MTTDKDLAEMFRASQNVDVLHLSDNEILQGFKDANSNIVREYFYGYCRIASTISDMDCAQSLAWTSLLWLMNIFYIS